MDSRLTPAFEPVKLLRHVTAASILVTAASAAAQTTPPADGKQSGYETRDTFGGPSGVSQELQALDDFRDALFEPEWTEVLGGPWFDWKRKLNDEYRLKLGVNVLMLAQTGSEDGNGGDDSGAGGIYRFQGSWDAYSNENSSGKFEWRVEARSNIGGVPAPQSLGGTYVAALNTGFPYGDNFDADLAILSWKQVFTEQRWGYAVGRLAFDVYLDPSAVQSPYRGYLNRSFLFNPTLATTGIGALGAVAKGFVSDNVWIGAQIYDGNAASGEFDWDTVQEGEYLKAVEIGWTPDYARRATDRVQFTYWEKDEREEAGVSDGSGWALSATRQVSESTLAFLRAGGSDGGAGVAAESAISAGLEYKPWKQRTLSVGIGWAEPSEETYGTGLDDEMVLETSYKIQLTRNFSLTPDLQWIRNPARLPDESNMWLFGVRAILTL